MLRGFDWKRLSLTLGVVGSMWFVLENTTRADTALSDFYFSHYADHAEVIDYGGEDTEIVIPETSRGLPVTSIGKRALRAKDLTKVTFPERLETIEEFAFDSNSLTEIEIPASVTSIGHFAFRNNALTKVTLHEGLQTLGAAVFQGSVISEIEIPSTVQFMEMNAFNGIGLTKLKLNEGLPEVGYGIFQHNKLTEVEIPSTVKTIERFAFRDNKLNRVTLHEGLENIWYSAFDYNELTSIVIPSTVNKIYGDAFYSNKLAFAVIPPSVNTIEPNSFGSNPPDFTIIGSPGSPAHHFATTYNYPFTDAATIPLPDIQFSPNSQDWSQSAEVTVTGATYNIFNLKYAWSNTVTEPGPEAEWRLWGLGDEIEQTVEGDWFLHVQGSLLDRAASWHSERFRVDRTSPTLGITMMTGLSPYANDTWSAAPVTLSATASDPFGEIREIVVEMEHDSRSSVAAYPGNTHSILLGANGTYQLKITAIDQAGNVSAMEQRIVKINISSNSSSSPSGSTPYEKSSNAKLKELLFSGGALTPMFSQDVTQYTLRISPELQSLTATLLPEHGQASTSLGGQALGSGRVKQDILLESDIKQLEIAVTAEDGTKRTYHVMLQRGTVESENAEHLPSESACSKSSPFTDIAGHWGEASIIEASCKKIIQGYPDGSFKPDRIITRAEFTVMLTGFFPKKDAAASPSFSDLANKEHWAKQAIAQAAAAGLVSGYPDGRFQPDKAISRVEMAYMLAKTIDLPTDTYSTTGFNDDTDIPDWAKNAVESLRRLGIVNGRGNTSFAPDGAATRAEAALMLLRISKMK